MADALLATLPEAALWLGVALLLALATVPVFATWRKR